MPELAVHIALAADPVYGSVATSPQLPGWVMARATIELLLRDLDGELDRAGAAGHRVRHQDDFFAFDGREYALRMALDEYADERAALLEGIRQDIAEGRTTVSTRLVSDPLGVVGVVACRREDKVGWLRDQVEAPFAWAAAVPSDLGGTRDWVFRQFVSRDVPLPDYLTPLDAPPEVFDWTLGQLVDSAPTLDMKWGGIEQAPRTAAMFELLDRQAGADDARTAVLIL